MILFLTQYYCGDIIKGGWNRWGTMYMWERGEIHTGFSWKTWR